VTLAALNGPGAVLAEQQSQTAGLAAGDTVMADRTLWLRPWASFIDQGPRNAAPGFAAEVRGLVLGGDFRPAARWRLGAALAWHDADITSAGAAPGAAQRSALTGWQAFLTASRAVGERGLLTGQVDVARLRTQGRRLLPTFGLQADSVHDGTAVHAGLAYTRQTALGARIDWLPALRLDWTRLHSEGYRERGAGALGLVVAGNVQQAAIVALDSGFELRAGQDVRVGLSVGVGWDVLAEQAVALAGYAGGGATFATPGIRPAPVMGRAGVEIEAPLGRGGQIALGYAAELRADHTRQSAALTLRWAF